MSVEVEQTATAEAPAAELRMTAADVYAQKEATYNSAPAEATVREMVDSAVMDLQLPRHDAHGQPLVYYARLEREGRQLNGGERLGDALRSGDRLVIVHQIQAGGCVAS